jgi:hypothetical protein
MHDPTPVPSYSQQAALQDLYLDQCLAQIRVAESAGDITIREAADLRVAALEHHLEAVVSLRTEFFGDPA